MTTTAPQATAPHKTTAPPAPHETSAPSALQENPVYPQCRKKWVTGVFSAVPALPAQSEGHTSGMVSFRILLSSRTTQAPSVALHSLRRWPSDAGMVTVEAALALVAMMVVVVVSLAGIGAGLTQLRLSDAAQTVARSVSRGQTPPSAAELHLPAEAQVRVATQAGSAQVTVETPAGMLPLTLHAEATMPLEQVTE